MRILVTGGAGFIGSALCRFLVADTDHHVVNVDKLTYAGNLNSLRPIGDNVRHRFVQADICDRAAMNAVFDEFKPDAVIHLAAETHVDRSIDEASAFVQTNIVGTLSLLETARSYLARSDEGFRAKFRFIHVSTDEVYGSLEGDALFTEDSKYDPRSPYAASKASADHLVGAWHATYGLSTIITNCSNNYGPYQFPEKLIPLTILNAIEGKPLPVYGDGSNVRDWLHVEDHARALYRVLLSGQVGRKYNIGANNERKNIDVVGLICDCLDKVAPLAGPRRELIRFVTDRPGHDRRYAIDGTRVRTELGWQASVSFEAGIDMTVRWYLANEWWWGPLRARYAGDRLGLGKS